MPHRHCAVEIYNNTGCFTLNNPRVFVESGHCEVPLPPVVEPYCSANALFNKSSGCATGAVGVFTYDLSGCDRVLAVMFSVPYDRNLYSNWVGVGVFERDRAADYDLYDLMYNGEQDGFVRAQGDGAGLCYQGDLVQVSASMSDGGEAVLRLDLSDTGMY